MQIFVDADACPVVDIVEEIAEKYNIPTTLLCDTNHILYSDQVIAKLAMLVRNLELKQGRIRAQHESWNKKWITGHFRRTLISPRLYGVGKSQAMKDFKLLMYCR